MMKRMKKNSILIVLTALLLLVSLQTQFVYAENKAQQPTIAIPTVTGTPKGVIAKVLLDQPDPVNVRSGPDVFFDKVGVLLPGQEVAVLGRSAGGDWILIDYPGAPDNIGWVYSPLVDLSPGELPIVEPPATLTPEVTQTVDPTLAAQFITTPNYTRMPTYTPVTPLVIATYQDVSRVSLLGRIPMGLVILILGGMGGLLALFSFVRAR